MTDVVQYTPQQELVQQVRSEQFRSEVALALPENVTPERFVRVAITALQASPAIAELERQSVHRALLQSAAMGLLPDAREAAIVPFKGKAQLIAMVGGLRKIAAEYGWTIYTAIAYEHDTFEYEQGLDVRFRHVPVRPGAERGEPIAAYAVGKHADGRRELEVLTVPEVEKIRAVSQSGQKPEGPWVNWWHQMAEKSAAKRLFKKLPLSEDDKRVRIIRAAVEPVEAAAQMYGPDARAALAPGETVDVETGEIVGSGADEPPQAEEPDHPPAGSSVPEDDPEPGADPADDDVAKAGETVVPAGAQGGKTLAQIAALDNGEDYLAWMSRNAGKKPVPPEVHAALQRFRPDLFQAKS